MYCSLQSILKDLYHAYTANFFAFNSPFQILVLTWEYGNEQMHQFSPSEAPKTAQIAFLLSCKNK